MSKIIRVFILSLSLSLATHFCLAAQETVTITTYYPAPYAAYNYLEIKKSIAVGDITSSGTVGINEVEDLTSGELFVGESVIFGQHSGTPPPLQSKTGELIYDASADCLKYFNGSVWLCFGATGSLYIAYCGGRWEGLSYPCEQRCSFAGDTDSPPHCLESEGFFQLGTGSGYGACLPEHDIELGHNPAYFSPVEQACTSHVPGSDPHFSMDGTAYLCSRGGGGCYIAYCDSNSAYCNFGGTPCRSDFTQIGTASTWGYCYKGPSNAEYYFRPPNGSCQIYPAFQAYDAGRAYLCCK